MSSQAAHDGSPSATSATGKFRRWLTRRVAVCAAVAAGIIVSGAAGWFLQSLLHPQVAEVETDEQPVEAANPDEPARHRTGDDSLVDRQTSRPLGAVGDIDQRQHDAADDGSADSHEGAPSVGLSFVGTLDHTNVDNAEQSLDGAGDDRTPDAGVPSVSELDRAAALGESYMVECDAAQALQQFDWVLKYQDRSRDDRFHYRCGICAESTGELNRALQEYGTALTAAQDPTIIALCHLGQARVWRTLGNIEFALQLLSSAWLTNGREGHAPLVQSFNAYLLADALAADSLAERTPPLTDAGGVLFPDWEFDLFERTLLSSIRQADAGQEPIKGGVRVLPDSTAADGTPDVALEVNLPRMGVVNLVEALCRAADYRVVWSSGARQAANGRSAEICQARAGLPMCLDALTAPLEIVWAQGDREIQMSATDEVDATKVADGRRRAARRAVEHAVRQHPDFVLAPQALVALGNIALSDGRGDDALRLYNEVVEKYPRDPVRSAAWFNLAKLHLGRDHTDAALDAFWHVVDSGGAPEVASVAYLYIGRLLIDAEQPRRAITPLIRATKWAPGSAVRTKSVLCLAAAYLLYGNPKGANEVLADFRGDVESQAIEAAFLSALARHRVANSPPRRFVEGQALLTAVDPVKPEDFFGDYGWYLCGSAYEELLFPEIAAGIYQRALDLHERPPYHDAVVFGLARCLAETGDVAAARHRLTGLVAQGAPEWQREAAFRLCRLQLDSNLPQAAAQSAHALVALCTNRADKARALQLLGESYQRLGDHAAAAMCFAGSVPDHPPPAETVKQ